MTEVPKPKPTRKNETTANEVGNGICGIVMPISTMSDDYTKLHWSLVKEVIDTAIEKAGFQSRPAWVDPSKDVIHAKIIKNIYECEIIICDLSNLNPNVMLETGIRLSTKKPIIIITDGVTKPPFDINPIEYIEYPRNLNYKDTILFINELSSKILDTSELYRSGSYVPFMHHYTYDIVSPESRVITENQFIENEMREVKSIILKLLENQNKEISQKIPLRESKKLRYSVDNDESAKLIENELGKLLRDIKYDKVYEFTHDGEKELNIIFTIDRRNFSDYQLNVADKVFKWHGACKV
ncbi:hypothetical protein [Gluconobacter frateurii]|uniref:Nucleoside 2-deoxyribosyltransferase n=1 Tax=Gluconobacter frateurii NRIC 0228 TaxID=1307946 RepID=A0ABQ0QE63_9PROT|nr:hypothetical protein [Gluconobacter frateurii]GBR15475.1 hypothetical protein AA0228_2521 [Gluconobacter frateurii NRIC 0228]GLP90317.1 hypothetical protein GCM10007868_13920 [Gluconobacter frateurii]